MALFSEPIETVIEEVKRGGVFGKKYSVSLFIYEDHIRGSAFEIIDGSLLSLKEFDIPLEKIISANVETIEGVQCTVLIYNKDTVVSNVRGKLAFWGLSSPQKWAASIENALSKRKNLIEQTRQQRLADQRMKKEESIQFYTSCYEFHIKPDTPFYTISSDENVFIGFYVTPDKSLCFVSIDGNRKQEDVGVIPYDKIHYYDKAGNLSYVTDIHGSYSSYGGSMTGGSFSKVAAGVGGLLFGYIGMTAGALFSYKPAKSKPIQTDFKLNSDIVKIDDRNVILNFFSDEKKQYIDIELPQDSYNFLQTHLPEKKHSIVEELEKRAAAHQAKQDIESGRQLHIGQSESPKLTDSVLTKEDSMESFKIKVEKLKIMKESGLLSEEEFEEERKKLLKMI